MVSSLEGQNIQTQCKVLSYWIDSHFQDYNPAIEID